MRGINIALNYLQILILKFDSPFYIDILLFIIVSQSDYNFVITLDLIEFSTRQLFMIIFCFINMKLLHTQNITIPNSMNIVTNLQRYIFPHAVLLIWCLKRVMPLGFGFVFLCSLSNYFPVFYWTL